MEVRILKVTYVTGLRNVLVVNVDGFDYVASGSARKATRSRKFPIR